MYNKIELVGRIQKAPFTKITTNNKEILTFLIDFNYNNRNRNLDFITVVLFDRLTKQYKEQLKEGSLLRVHGKLETHSFTNKNDQKIKTFNVNAETIEFLQDDEEQQYLDKNFLLNENSSI